MRLLTKARTVHFANIVSAIERFNDAGLNPFGPNVPVGSHSPLLVKLEGPGMEVEFEVSPADRKAKTRVFLAVSPSFRTRHAVLYPMTRALVQRQWTRVYAYNVRQSRVTDVRLLVCKEQDPVLFERHPKASAQAWILALKNASEPLALHW